MNASPDAGFLALQQALRGRYSLERELGRGGMGIVYLAHEVRLDRPVALKLLPPPYAVQPVLRERFLREARTAARLSHPNIVSIHAVDEVDDFVFFVMAYVEGETLGQRVRERGPVPPREAARILREVAWALGYAHAQGVIHRDVKPDNIMLESGSGRALVTDFGIAHVSERPALTSGTELLGTAEFMSPEQASGEAVDARSDIYALGVVGHYLLSGRLPFEGPTVAATLARQITQAAPPLARVAPGLPAHLCEAIDRCLAKDATDRFADGSDLAEAIDQAPVAQRSVPAALRSFSERCQEATGPIRALALMTLLSLSVTVFLAIDGAPPSVTLVQGLIAALFGVAPAGILIQIARRVLRSGYSHDEAVRALRTEVEERRAQLAAEGEPGGTRLERIAARSAAGALAIYVAGLGWMALGPYFPWFETVVVPIMGVAATTFLGVGLYSAVRHVVRGGMRGERWLRFWHGRVGRAIFEVAGVRLERLPGAGGSYRPTELAIGMAADRLFEDLPKDVRSAFAELPAIVRALEHQAEAMRARIEELSGVLNEIDADERSGGRAPESAERRGSLADQVRTARAAAETRLSQVVAALETIRLELLRLHAGVGSVESMTADLGSARELAEGLSHLVDARREVDALLAESQRQGVDDTPVPA